MSAARRLRSVPSAPERESKPTPRAMKVRGPITASPNPIEATVICRAQSLLTCGGKIGPVLSYGTAQQVLAGIAS